MTTSIHKKITKGFRNGLLFAALGVGLPVFAQYSSSEAIQNTQDCFPGMNNASVLEVQVVTSGSSSVLTAMQFNTNGTNNTSNLESAKLYYYNGGSFNAPLTNATQVGSVVNSPNGSFSFTGMSVNLSSGTNRFYLVYDLPYTASVGDYIDAECTSITVDGNSETPSVTAPSGEREIVKNGVAYNYCPYNALVLGNYQIGISRLQLGSMVITNVIATSGTVQTIDTPVMTLIKGVTYDLSYRGGSGNNQNEKIYVDFNNDGFYEESEAIFSGVTPASTETTGTIDVDCGLENGIHRVRIATDLNGVVPYACGQNFYGTAFEVLVDFQDAPQPTAAFDAPATAYRGAYIPLPNNSQGLSYDYRWDYDNDGTVDATTIDGEAQYTTAGNKTVELAMSKNSCGNMLSDSTTKQINVIDPPAVPSCEFIANRNVTNQTLEVRFKDLSTNGANKWHWKITPENVNGNVAYVYANGTDSTSQNPVVLFLELGAYNVEFYSENVIGAGNYISKPDYIRNIAINDFCSITSTTSESGFIADEGGVFSNYPNYATVGNLCGFLIKPTCASTISFNFLDFDMSSYQVTNCNIPGSNPPVLQPSDHVKIYDGVDNTGIPLHVAAGFPNGFTNGPANTPLPSLPPTVTATSGSMYIEYSVNCAFNGRGFLGEWSSTPKTLPTPVASFDGPDTVYTDAPYIFTNTSTGDFDESSWDYDNNGLNDFSGKDAEITFTQPGVQTIKLYVARCGNGSDFTKDVVVLAPTSAPVVEFEATRTACIVQDTIRLIDRSDNGPNSWKWTITPSADVEYVSGSNSTSRNPFVKFKKTGMYEVKLVASNSLGADSLVKSSYIGVFAYCTPNSINLSADIGMSQVEFAGINRSSDVGVNSYIQFDDEATVQQGATYPITLNRTTNFNNISYKVWIDFNKNGSFNDAGEEVFFEPSSSALTVNGSIRIPKSASEGVTRMRVGANTAGNMNMSCGPNQFGEFEDYRISILTDTEKPVISLIGNPIIYIERGFTYNDQGATAFDNSDGDITSLIQVNDNLDVTQTGEYWYSYNVTDSAGNKADSVIRRIIVQPDGSGPVITLTGGDTIFHEVNTTWNDPGVNAVDFVDGVISVINTSGSVNSSQLGTYYITYSASDLQGNTSTGQRVVKVVDQTAPTLTLLGADPLILDYGTPFADPGVTVNDNYYAGLNYTRTGVVNTKIIGQVVVTYGAKDPSGNVANTITRTIEVKDVSAPKIVLFGRDTMTIDVFDKYVEPGYSVSDNHTKGLSVNVTGVVNSSVLGEYTLTYTSTDSSGNVATLDRVVNVVDREAPVIILKGSSLIYINRFDDILDPGVTIQDNYDSEASLQANLIILDGVVTDQEGLYQYCYEVTDNSGNRAVQVCRLVNVGPADPNGVNLAADGNIRVYPNPSNGPVWVELDANMQATQVKVYDARGAVVKTQTVDKQIDKVRLDMEGIEPGIYYIVVNAGDKTYTAKLNFME